MSRYCVHMAQLYRVNTVILRYGNPWGFSTQYFAESALLSAGDATTAVHNFWNAIKSYISDQVAFQVQTDVPVINIDNGEIQSIADGGSPDQVTGTDEGDPLPYQTQLVGRLRTGVYISGRELRGRIFIPGIGEGNSVLGAPSGAVIDTVNDALTPAFVPSLSAEGVVYSRTHHVAAPVSLATCATTFAVLRSRRQ